MENKLYLTKEGQKALIDAIEKFDFSTIVNENKEPDLPGYDKEKLNYFRPK